MKWKGSLFFRFVTALVDEDIQIRKFGKKLLKNVLEIRGVVFIFDLFYLQLISVSFICCCHDILACFINTSLKAFSILMPSISTKVKKIQFFSMFFVGKMFLVGATKYN